MKKKLTTFILICLFCSSCGTSKHLTYKDPNTNIRVTKKVEQYGFIDKDSKKIPNVRYKIVWGNVLLAAISIQSIIGPIIVLGWYLYEPVDVPERIIIMPR